MCFLIDYKTAVNLRENINNAQALQKEVVQLGRTAHNTINSKHRREARLENIKHRTRVDDEATKTGLAVTLWTRQEQATSVTAMAVECNGNVENKAVSVTLFSIVKKTSFFIALFQLGLY